MLSAKNKMKASFRQFTPRQYHFEPSEQKCPLNINGLINRSYKRKCADEIKREDEEINKMPGKTFEEKKENYIKMVEGKILAFEGKDFEEKKKNYFASLLQNIRKDVIDQKKKAIEIRGRKIYEKDPLNTIILKKYCDEIFASVKASDSAKTYDKIILNIDNDNNKDIQKYILLKCFEKKTTDYCSSATGPCTNGGLFSKATDPDGENAKHRSQDQLRNIESKKETFMDKYNENPLLSAFLLDFFYVYKLSGYEIPFKANPIYLDVYDLFLKRFTEKWYDELALKHHNYCRSVPENPFMFYMFISDEENEKVLAPQIASIIIALKRKGIDSGLRNWSKEIRKTDKRTILSGGRKRMKDIDYPDYLPQKSFSDNSLSMLPYKKEEHAGGSDDPPDLSQGLQFSDSGKITFILILGSAIVRSAYDIQYEQLKIDTTLNIERWLLKSYEYLCQIQENHFKTFKEWIPYSLSEFNEKGSFFPYVLPHQLQSLSNLNVRLYGNRPVCSACSKGYDTYYGSSLLAINKRRPGLNKGDTVEFKESRKDKKWHKGKIKEVYLTEVVIEGSNNRFLLAEEDDIIVPIQLVRSVHANTTGICTKVVDDILDLLETPEERNNPWYIRWVGTYEQAARRLKSYKKEQAILYDNNSPNYNFVDYYSNLILLQLDYWVKKLFNVCNVKVDESGDENMPLTKEEASFWSSVLDDLQTKWTFGGALAGSVTAAATVATVWGTSGLALPAAAALGLTAGGLAGAYGDKILGKMYTLIRAGGMILYKLFTMILKMPFVQEVIVNMVQEQTKKICEKNAIAANKVTIRNYNSSEEEVKEFDPKNGRWISLSRSERKKEAKKMADNKSRKFWKQISTFQSVLSTVVSDDSYIKKAVETLSLNGDHSPIKRAMGLVEKIPGVEKILKHLNITPDNLTALLSASLLNVGRKSWDTIIASNNGVRRVMTLYDSISNASGGCLDTKGNLVLTNGGTASEGEQYCAYAFEQMIHNVPYYTMMILNAMYKQGAQPNYNSQIQVNENWMTEFEVQFQNLVSTQLVPCGKPAHKKQKYPSWGKNQKALEEIYKKQLEQYQKIQWQRHVGGIQRVIANGNAKFAADVAKIKKEGKKAADNIKEIKEKTSSSWGWWVVGGIVLAAAIGIGIAAVGGPAAALALVAKAGSATAGAVSAGGSAAAGAVYNFAGAVSNSYVGMAAGTVAKGAVATMIKDGIYNIGDKLSKDPAAVSSLMFIGGNIIMGTVEQAQEMYKHWDDDYKVLPIEKVLESQPKWKDILRKKIQVKMGEFVGVIDRDATLQKNHCEEMKLKPADLDFESVTRIKIALTHFVGLTIFLNDDMFWWFVNLKQTVDFFEQYSPPECFLKDEK